MGGDDGSSGVMPSAPSASSADSNVIWLDITEPSRISSAVRSDTSGTSYPCRTRPRLSAVPAGPAPTTAMRRGELMPASVSPAYGVEHRRPRRGQRVDHVEVVDVRELAVVEPLEPAL